MTVTRRLWLLAGLFAICVYAVYLLAVRTTLGQRIDEAALVGRTAVPDDLIADAWTILDGVGLLSVVLVVGVLWFVGLYRGATATVLAVSAAILGANVTTQLLKRVVFERPALLDGIAATVNSLPSGHTTVAASVGFGMVLVVAPRWRAWTALGGAGYAAVVGTATVTAGWHRPSDAIAAVFVVGACTAAAAAVAPSSAGTQPGTLSTGLMWVVGVGAALLALGSGAGWLAMRAASELGDSSVVDAIQRGLAHLTAGAVIGVTAVAVTGAIVAALARPAR